MAGDMVVEWQVDYLRQEISFAVTAATLGWVGFGFGLEPNQMLGADVVTGWVDDVTQEVYVRLH